MSEFRKDLVSGEWIIMAPERAKRPHDMLAKIPKRIPAPKRGCPFENPETNGNWPPILVLPKGSDINGAGGGKKYRKWDVILLPNKFPAVAHQPGCAAQFHEGPYTLSTGIGYHDLVITRDHNKNFPRLAVEQATDVFRILRERYHMLKKDDCIMYVSAMHNWGPTVGASIYHPHYQVFSLPIIPPNIMHSLHGSELYARKHRRCVHCEIVKYEQKARQRVVDQNAHAIAVAPFTSYRPFETKIFPKKHRPYFEMSTDAELKGCTLLLRSVLRRMEKYLHDPDLNFYIHTAPLKKQENYEHYHWHIEVVPNVPPSPGGFELGTGIEINTVLPERAAALLRGEKIR